MSISKVFPVLLLLLNICPKAFINVRCDQFYIVTSRQSACPSELRGEPCLTLQEYVSKPLYSYNNDTTLVLEPGKHELAISGNLAKSYINNFTMTSDNVIIYISTSNLVVRIRNVHTVHISGIIFTGYGTIRIGNTEVINIEDCNFLGTVLRLDFSSYQIMVNITRTHFSDYCDPDSNSAYNTVAQSSMLYLYSYYYRSASNYNVTVSHCTFINSRGINVGGTIDTLSIIHNNFSDNVGRAIYVNSYSYGESLLISKCIFINNQVEGNGGAVYIATEFDIIIVNASTFIGNRVTRKNGYGGAIYFDIDSRYDGSVLISESNFISNSASYGGALSIVDYYQTQFDVRITIIDSVFSNNKALDTIGSGGVAFISDAHVLVSNCTFTHNMAARDGGVIHADYSFLSVSNSSFKRNIAGNDGGVFSTYVRSTNYTITQSIFTSNQAGDDGGAIFVGQRGGQIVINECSFRNNHAVDRGGAITIFGSQLTITTTNIHANRARIGNSISACYSNVSTTIPGPLEIRDHNKLLNLFCAEYDADSMHHHIQEPKELSYPNIIPHHSKSKGSCTSSSIITIDEVLSRLYKANTTAYTAISISITLAIALLVYAIIKIAIQYQMKVKSRRCGLQQTTLPVQNQDRSGDSANTDREIMSDLMLQYKTSEDLVVTPNSVYNISEDIEMTPNSVYNHATTTHTYETCTL